MTTRSQWFLSLATKKFSTIGRPSPKRLLGKTRRADEFNFKPLRVALIGRPNVGKSTLFNALTTEKERSRKAIISDVPGTTRDRREGKGRLGEINLTLIDTGGFEDPSLFTKLARDMKLKSDDSDHFAPESFSIAGPHGVDLVQNMLNQMRQAINESNVALFIIDGKQGVTEEDKHFARYIRKNCNLITHRSEDLSQIDVGRIEDKIKLVVNKIDNAGAASEYLFNDCYNLGFGEPIFMSALQKSGLGDLYSALEDFSIEEKDPEEEAKKDLIEASPREKVRLAIIGRPNVGKSTLLNAFVGQERVITGPIAGLTRDSISVDFNYNNYEVVFVDTAGIRRSVTMRGSNSTRARLSKFNYEQQVMMMDSTNVGKLEKDLAKQLELKSIEDSLRALELCDVAIFVVDVMAQENEQDIKGVLTKHDLSILGRCFEEGKAVVLAANKADLSGTLLNEKTAPYVLETIRRQVEAAIPAARSMPIVPISALNKLHTQALLDTAISTFEKAKQHISTPKLNKWLQSAVKMKKPPVKAAAGFTGLNDKGRQKRIAPLKLKYITQVGNQPPLFLIFTNRRTVNRDAIPDTYLRYLMNNLREQFGFEGVPLRLQLRSSEGKDSH